MVAVRGGISELTSEQSEPLCGDPASRRDSKRVPPEGRSTSFTASSHTLIAGVLEMFRWRTTK